MIDIPSVLVHLRPGEEWALNGDEYDGLTWLSDTTPPTLAECEAAWVEIKRDVLLRPIRAERDRRLAASDWTQIADSPADAAAWAEYRQALRDLPATIKDPTAEVAWPETPK
jgi:hypothetical protein